MCATRSRRSGGSYFGASPSSQAGRSRWASFPPRGEAPPSSACPAIPPPSTSPLRGSCARCFCALPAPAIAKELVADALTKSLMKEAEFNHIAISPDGSKLALSRRVEETMHVTVFNRVDMKALNDFTADYGGGYLYRYTFPGRIAQCGVESLRGVSIWTKRPGEPYDDLDTANVAAVFQQPQRIAELSAAAIQSAAQKYLDTNNYVRVTLIPETR